MCESEASATMCAFLDLSKSTYYYHADLSSKRAQKAEDTAISKEIARIFKKSKNNYDTRKIKKEIPKLPKPMPVSRRRIGRFTKEQGLVSNYTIAQFKPRKSMCNEAPIKNELQRQFKQEEPLAVIVSDLAYVRVGTKWHYVCLFVDLFNLEFIGHSAGASKSTEPVYQALSSMKGNLNDVQLFHTDRGKEFDNQLISEALEAFGVQRSLSMKGCPDDRT